MSKTNRSSTLRSNKKTKDKITPIGEPLVFYKPIALSHAGALVKRDQSREPLLVADKKTTEIPKDTTLLLNRCLDGLLMSIVRKTTETITPETRKNLPLDLRFADYRIDMFDLKNEARLPRLSMGEMAILIENDFKCMKLELNVLQKVEIKRHNETPDELLVNESNIRGFHSIFDNAHLDMTSGKFYFTFGRLLTDLLNRELNQYTKLVSATNHLSSIAAVKIYQLCKGFAKVGRTSYIELPTFLRLIGAKDSYKDFCALHRRKIKPAIVEINDKCCDIEISFNIDEDTKTEAPYNKVTALRFRIKTKTLPKTLLDETYEESNLNAQEITTAPQNKDTQCSPENAPIANPTTAYYDKQELKIFIEDTKNKCRVDGKNMPLCKIDDDNSIIEIEGSLKGYLRKRGETSFLPSEIAKRIWERLFLFRSRLAEKNQWSFDAEGKWLYPAIEIGDK